MLDKVNNEEPHAHQLGKLLETSQVLAAKGETVEPGFKVAIISKPSLAEKIEAEK